MNRRVATEKEVAIAIAAFNAFVDLWNCTESVRRHVVFTRIHPVDAGRYSGEFEEELQELNPAVSWPIELLDDEMALRRCRDRQCIRPRAGVPGHREHQFVRFALPDGTAFDLRTRGAWRPFAERDQRYPLTAADVRRAWVMASPPARR